MSVPPKNETKNIKQNQKEVPQDILHKELNQIKSLKTARYLDTR